MIVTALRGLLVASILTGASAAAAPTPCKKCFGDGMIVPQICLAVGVKGKPNPGFEACTILMLNHGIRVTRQIRQVRDFGAF